MKRLSDVLLDVGEIDEFKINVYLFHYDHDLELLFDKLAADGHIESARAVLRYELANKPKTVYEIIEEKICST